MDISTAASAAAAVPSAVKDDVSSPAFSATTPSAAVSSPATATTSTTPHTHIDPSPGGLVAAKSVGPPSSPFEQSGAVPLPVLCTGAPRQEPQIDVQTQPPPIEPSSQEVFGKKFSSGGSNTSSASAALHATSTVAPSTAGTTPNTTAFRMTNFQTPSASLSISRESQPGDPPTSSGSSYSLPLSGEATGAAEPELPLAQHIDIAAIDAATLAAVAAGNGEAEMPARGAIGTTSGSVQSVASASSGHSQHSRPQCLDDRTRNPCKIFVGGIGQSTTEQSIRDHFSKFGPVLDCAIVSDRKSGRSRGFGFVTFPDAEAVERVLREKHKIDNVLVECRRALPREEARGTAPYDTMYMPNKLFVGGIPEFIQEEHFREFFSRFGTVLDASLAYDKNKHRPRGFGFIVYEDMASVDAAVGRHFSGGKWVEAKRAVPRELPCQGRGRSRNRRSRSPPPIGSRGHGGGAPLRAPPLPLQPHQLPFGIPDRFVPHIPNPAPPQPFNLRNGLAPNPFSPPHPHDLDPSAFGVPLDPDTQFQAQQRYADAQLIGDFSQSFAPDLSMPFGYPGGGTAYDAQHLLERGIIGGLAGSLPSPTDCLRTESGVPDFVSREGLLNNGVTTGRHPDSSDVSHLSLFAKGSDWNGGIVSPQDLGEALGLANGGQQPQSSSAFISSSLLTNSDSATRLEPFTPHSGSYYRGAESPHVDGGAMLGENSALYTSPFPSARALQQPKPNSLGLSAGLFPRSAAWSIDGNSDSRMGTHSATVNSHNPVPFLVTSPPQQFLGGSFAAPGGGSTGASASLWPPSLGSSAVGSAAGNTEPVDYGASIFNIPNVPNFPALAAAFSPIQKAAGVFAQLQPPPSASSAVGGPLSSALVGRGGGIGFNDILSPGGAATSPSLLSGSASLQLQGMASGHHPLAVNGSTIQGGSPRYSVDQTASRSSIDAAAAASGVIPTASGNGGGQYQLFVQQRAGESQQSPLTPMEPAADPPGGVPSLPLIHAFPSAVSLASSGGYVGDGNAAVTVPGAEQYTPGSHLGGGAPQHFAPLGTTSSVPPLFSVPPDSPAALMTHVIPPSSFGGALAHTGSYTHRSSITAEGPHPSAYAHSFDFQGDAGSRTASLYAQRGSNQHNPLMFPMASAGNSPTTPVFATYRLEISSPSNHAFSANAAPLAASVPTVPGAGGWPSGGADVVGDGILGYVDGAS